MIEEKSDEELLKILGGEGDMGGVITLDVHWAHQPIGMMRHQFGHV